MRTYVVRRLVQAVLVLWAAYTLSFLLLSALPGDAVSNRIQDPEAQITPEAGRQMLEFYGLDRPIWEQYLRALWSLLHGDLGFSLSTGKPVTQAVVEVLPSTAALTGLGLVFGLGFAVLVAVAANYAPWAWLRGVFDSAPALFASVPTFVVGVLALQYLSFRWHLIPSVDNGTPLALLAPAATLGLIVAAPMAQVFATSVRTTRRQPFVHVVAARGAGEGYLFRQSVLRNSSLPVLTLLGLAFGELIAGAVVTESVYARQGIGQLTVGAVDTQDLPVVQGVVLLSTLAYVLVNLAVDLAYPFLDPRVLVDGRTRRVTSARGTERGENAVPVSVGAAVSPRLPAEVVMP
ncbi:ABC transporter permease [Nocardia sp. AG03]|uniref:ABC transporter permease n=1 Tax=Nocardia sp. AG03 TaxID=3025312 RepID=UPI00241875CA|nr:ABC transporter permease [Nocardia sp. AG03]